MNYTPSSLAVDWDAIDKKVLEWLTGITNRKNHLFIDFETYYDQTYSLKKKSMTYVKYVKNDLFKVHTAQVAKAEGEVLYLVGEDEIRKYLQENVTKETVLIAQNTMFDGLIVTEHFGIRPGFYLDILGMSRARNPHETFHDLGSQAKRIWPDDQSKWKLSGDAVDLIDNVRDLTEWHHDILRPYGIRDTEVLRNIFYHYIDEGFPDEELLIQHILLRNYLEPIVEADIPLLEKTYEDAVSAQNKAVAEALEYIYNNADLPRDFFVCADDRDKETFKTLKSHKDAYQRYFGGLSPIRKPEEAIKFLSSNDKFVYILQKGFGIEVKKKPSPTPKDPYNETWALGKDDVAFQEMMAEFRELKVVWEGRLLSKSNQAKTRAASMMETAALLDGKLPIPLKYAAAHTHRFGGGQGLNFQNFGRGSNHRLALKAPEGMVMMVQDSSNIESRMSAAFCEHEEKLELFRTGGDPYNATATGIFGYEVDRKSKTVDHSVQGMVGKATELGCGYQMGEKRFRNFLNAGPLGMPPIFLEDVEDLKDLANPYKHVINAYRTTNWPTRNMWYTLADTIKDLTYDHISYDMECGITVGQEKIHLPSGLALHYPMLRSGKDGYQYKGKDGWIKIFGGKLLENIIQALSRIIVCKQMIWVDAYLHVNDLGRVVLQVHDEVVSLVKMLGATRKEDAATYTENGAEAFKEVNKQHNYRLYKNCELLDVVSDSIIEIMKRTEKWCEVVPLNAEGGYDYCYSK